MKNRRVNLYENTIFVHPLNVRVLHVIPWVSIAQPNTWFPPLNQFRFPVQTFHRDPRLATKPLLERREKLDSSPDIIKNSILGVSRLHTLIS